MNSIKKKRLRVLPRSGFLGASLLALLLVSVLWWSIGAIRPGQQASETAESTPVESGIVPGEQPSALQPRQLIDTSGYTRVIPVEKWPGDASLAEIGRRWRAQSNRTMGGLDRQLTVAAGRMDLLIPLTLAKAGAFMAAGKPTDAYDLLSGIRGDIERLGGPVKSWTLSTLMFFQGVAALRQGENENCIMCRGESSCILPISGAAVHRNPEGSRRAIRHFSEYLESFPEDLEVRWLLNLAHMTLGEHPRQVDPRFLVPLDRFQNSEFDIGRFRDIGHLVGVNRFNQAGGAVMEDIDNDGRLDLVVSSFDPTQALGIFRNAGDGRFEDRSAAAGVAEQFGGLTCVQTDYNNDGRMDIFVPRGAWLPHAIRPSLLRNDGDCRFTDVTEEAGLLAAVNSNAAQWADFDNDGWLDLFICCERQAHRLYRNRGDGTFEDVAATAGVVFDGQSFGKGCAWLDFDNDDYPDLFVNYLSGTGQLYRNNRDGTFENVTESLGIDGPQTGFSCWAWDYDNDGWLDIFATCYDRSLKAIVQGIVGAPHERQSNRLFRNAEGRGFQDVTHEAGLDLVFATMGSNFGDFDNDGYLDMYLATGDPQLTTLAPNRMFRNVAGTRFAEITGTAGVGHLQKGHGVACGDWDRDGNVDLFVELGGAVDGDKFHNVLFQNPGHAHHWITLKLVGTRTNRAALGARIKVVTAGARPMTIHRHVSSGSSFGGNPLEQTIGLATAERIERLEIHWPTSGTTQVFRDIEVDQCLEVTELAEGFQWLDRQPVKLEWSRSN